MNPTSLPYLSHAATHRCCARQQRNGGNDALPLNRLRGDRSSFFMSPSLSERSLFFLTGVRRSITPPAPYRAIPERCVFRLGPSSCPKQVNRGFRNISHRMRFLRTTNPFEFVCNVYALLFIHFLKAATGFQKTPQ